MKSRLLVFKFYNMYFFYIIFLNYLPLIICKLNLYLDTEETKRLLGLHSELFYVRNGKINTYATQFRVPIPPHVDDLKFTWQNLGDSIYQVPYRISFSYAKKGLMEEPKLNISPSGYVPITKQIFSIELKCLPTITAEVDFDIVFNVSLTRGHNFTTFKLSRKKICLTNGLKGFVNQAVKLESTTGIRLTTAKRQPSFDVDDDVSIIEDELVEDEGDDSDLFAFNRKNPSLPAPFEGTFTSISNNYERQIFDRNPGKKSFIGNPSVSSPLPFNKQVKDEGNRKLTRSSFWLAIVCSMVAVGLFGVLFTFLLKYCRSPKFLSIPAPHPPNSLKTKSSPDSSPKSTSRKALLSSVENSKAFDRDKSPLLYSLNVNNQTTKKSGLSYEKMPSTYLNVNEGGALSPDQNHHIDDLRSWNNYTASGSISNSHPQGRRVLDNSFPSTGMALPSTLSTMAGQSLMCTPHKNQHLNEFNQTANNAPNSYYSHPDVIMYNDNNSSLIPADNTLPFDSENVLHHLIATGQIKARQQISTGAMVDRNFLPSHSRQYTASDAIGYPRRMLYPFVQPMVSGGYNAQQYLNFHPECLILQPHRDQPGAYMFASRGGEVRGLANSQMRIPDANKHYKGMVGPHLLPSTIQSLQPHNERLVLVPPQNSETHLKNFKPGKLSNMPGMYEPKIMTSRRKSMSLDANMIAAESYHQGIQPYHPSYIPKGYHPILIQANKIPSNIPNNMIHYDIQNYNKLSDFDQSQIMSAIGAGTYLDSNPSKNEGGEIFYNVANINPMRQHRDSNNQEAAASDEYAEKLEEAKYEEINFVRDGETLESKGSVPRYYSTEQIEFGEIVIQGTFGLMAQAVLHTTMTSEPQGLPVTIKMIKANSFATPAQKNLMVKESAYFKFAGLSINDTSRLIQLVGYSNISDKLVQSTAFNELDKYNKINSKNEITDNQISTAQILIYASISINLETATYLQPQKLVNLKLCLSKYVETPENYRKLQIGTREFVTLFQQLIDGLNVLHSKGIAHGDIATRNLFVTDDLQNLKIGDTSLSRDLFPTEYACLGDNENRPIRWMAPEAIITNNYNICSDMWSVGVTFWETLNFGAIPFSDIDPFEVYTCLANGFRLNQPINCLDQLYSIIMKCMNANPEDRPKCPKVRNMLDDFSKTLNHFI